MRLSRRRFLLSGLSAAFAPAAAFAKSQSLWPGARHTAAQRQRAIERGLDYIYSVTKVPKHFAEFGPVEFLKFDPAKGSIPRDIPDPECDKCRRPAMLTPYEVLLDALITTWSGEHFGVKLGAAFPEVAALVPTLRPYRGAEGGKNK